MKQFPNIFTEMGTIWQVADRATGPWIAVTAAWAALSAALNLQSTAIVSLFGLIILDTIVGAWAFWDSDRSNFSIKLMFSRTFEKVAAMVLICAAALLFSLVAPDAREIALSGVLTAFAFRETASIIYNIHRIRPALVPQSVLDWVDKLTKKPKKEDGDE